MGKVVKAEYDAEHQTLRLLEPIEGFDDHERVSVMIDKAVDSQRPWLSLKGSLSKEAGDSLAAAIEEMFPTER